MTTTRSVRTKTVSQTEVQPLSLGRWTARLFPFAMAIFSGGLLFLSFPTWNFYLLAWAALVPLLFAIQNQSATRRFFLGWIAGVVYFTGALSWVTISMTRYGKIPLPISYILMLLLVAYLATYVGLFAGLIQYASQKGFWIFLFAPSLWTSLEFLRGRLFTGFPWAGLGYSQYRPLPVIQIADFAGVYGVSFVIVFINIALFRIIQAGRKSRRIAWKEALLAFSLLTLTLLYGFLRLSQPMGEERAVSVTVVQGNIDQDQKWDQQFRDATLRIYKRLSLQEAQHAASRPELVIWPESAAPFFFQDEPLYQMDLLDFARDGRFYLLFGSPSFEPAGGGQVALLNSAYLLSPGGGAPSRYDKMHLVPFGEYVPLSSLLFFVNKLVEGIGDFIPGREAAVMETASTKIGTVICFEVIFPEVVRQFVQNGATLMTTLTNDAWFGDSAAPYQHFSMVVFRSIENRVPFARAANTGISGFIDAYGRVTKSAPLFVEAALSEQLHPANRRTLYTRYGDFFAVGCAIITAGFIFYFFTKRRFYAH